MQRRAAHVFFRRARPICCRKTFPLVQLRAAHGSDLRVSWIFEEFRALEKVDFYDDTRVESDRVRAMPGFLCHARTRMLAAHCRKDWKNVSFNANVLFTFELFYFSKTIKLLLWFILQENPRCKKYHFTVTSMFIRSRQRLFNLELFGYSNKASRVPVKFGRPEKSG